MRQGHLPTGQNVNPNGRLTFCMSQFSNSDVSFLQFDWIILDQNKLELMKYSLGNRKKSVEFWSLTGQASIWQVVFEIRRDNGSISTGHFNWNDMSNHNLWWAVSIEMTDYIFDWSRSDWMDANNRFDWSMSISDVWIYRFKWQGYQRIAHHQVADFKFYPPTRGGGSLEK